MVQFSIMKGVSLGAQKTLWAPNFFAAAPNTSHVKLLTSQLLALWAP